MLKSQISVFLSDFKFYNIFIDNLSHNLSETVEIFLFYKENLFQELLNPKKINNREIC